MRSVVVVHVIMGDPVGALKHIRETLAPDATCLLVELFANDRLEDNLNPVARVYYAASIMICTPASLSQEVGLALGAQAGEGRLKEVARAAGFTRFRRAAETPFNIILKARIERASLGRLWLTVRFGYAGELLVVVFVLADQNAAADVLDHVDTDRVGPPLRQRALAPMTGDNEISADLFRHVDDHLAGPAPAQPRFRRKAERTQSLHAFVQHGLIGRLLLVDRQCVGAIDCGKTDRVVDHREQKNVSIAAQGQCGTLPQCAPAFDRSVISKKNFPIHVPPPVLKEQQCFSGSCVRPVADACPCLLQGSLG
jgi:hypothetical protein